MCLISIGHILVLFITPLDLKLSKQTLSSLWKASENISYHILQVTLPAITALISKQLKTCILYIIKVRT